MGPFCYIIFLLSGSILLYNSHDECIKSANRDASFGLAALLRKQRQYSKQIGELSREINNLVKAMKRGIISKDVQQEHSRLVEGRAKLQLAKDKIDVEVEVKQSKLLSIDIIQKGLRNFERVIEVLPAEDQKDLMQLLIKEIVVYPFDPKEDKIFRDSPGVFKTRIRTKWFKVKMSLYAIPDITIGCENLPKSSDSKKLGSSGRTRTYDMVVTN